ncbi:uncharacterized protein Z519_07604 [Cladophialophora bantiana CBS 173.52]|uniref:FAS1 domain-containing protein n=1 Tax=Cladophialophora bantiana (strain ATCC 10958 / CBS 173.52 / CDC B-1940 / NIH 8579) TaxID=1442370 RepID=A0A0D2ENS6_CLAB1|nr:uncharacterized protein Z519_07604 [Cladophialophora bantiana CBS 173.52]KIW91636.1 hypothetical protein Z519_07604 [Cladophialophora bantiana CBS 173.52]
MMLRQLFPLALCLGLVTAQAQGIIETLDGVAELSELVTYLDRYPGLTLWLQGLSDITFLAPNNDAFAALADSSTIPSIPLDEADAEALMSYHVLNGTFYDFSSGKYTLVPTALSGSQYANVTGGQIVAAKGSPWSNAMTFTSGKFHMSETEDEPLNFTGGVIHIIDSFLTLPQTFKATAEAEDMLGGPAFAEAAITVPQTGQNVSIDQLSDVTVFLPMNYSLQEVGNVIQNMTWAELNRLVAYHIIDQVLDIDPNAPPNGQYTTYEGSEVSIFSQNGFVFVNNARIVGSPNWFFSGGMIYTIYGVLNPDNTTVDPNINDAEIAFAGASFTPDFTFPAPASQSSPSNSPAASSSGGLSGGTKAGIGAATAVAVVVLVGVFLFLRERRRTARELGPRKTYQYPLQYPMKDFEASISHTELVANAAAPARGPIKEFTPAVSVYSLR